MSLIAELKCRKAIRVAGARGPRLILEVRAWLPSLGWLREDPRFYAEMRRTGAIGFWEAEGFPDGCRPADDVAGRRLDCSRCAP